MGKRQLEQIKIFSLEDGTYEDLQEKVNKYIVGIFNEEGNYPTIETNSRYITVRVNRLVDTYK